MCALQSKSRIEHRVIAQRPKLLSNTMTRSKAADCGCVPSKPATAFCNRSRRLCGGDGWRGEAVIAAVWPEPSRARCPPGFRRATGGCGRPWGDWPRVHGGVVQATRGDFLVPCHGRIRGGDAVGMSRGHRDGHQSAVRARSCSIRSPTVGRAGDLFRLA